MPRAVRGPAVCALPTFGSLAIAGCQAGQGGYPESVQGSWSLGKLLGRLAPIGLSLAATAQQTWIVDRSGGPGVHFTEVQPAVVAAAPGDRIEIRGTGYYPGFSVDRGLEIEAVQGAGCTSVYVLGVPANQHVRILGLGTAAPVAGQVLIVQCAGSVVLQDVRTLLIGNNQVAMRIIDSANVWLRSCTIDGRVFHTTLPAPTLVDLVGSDVVFDHCQLFAGTTLATIGGIASAAIGVGGGCKALIHGGMVVGGEGREEQVCGPSCCLGGGTGGAAIATVGSVVALGGAVLQGGTGTAAQPGCSPGNPATSAIVGLPAQVSTDCVLTPACVHCPRPILPSLSTNSRVALGGSAVLSTVGQVGHLAFLAVDFGTGRQVVPSHVVPWTLGPGAFTFGFVTLSATGTGQFVMAIPNQPTLRHIEIFCQVLGVDPVSLVPTIGGPTMLHVN